VSCESYFKCNLQSQVESNSIVGGSAWAVDCAQPRTSSSIPRIPVLKLDPAAPGIEWQSRVARNANNCTPMQTQTMGLENRKEDS